MKSPTRGMARSWRFFGRLATVGVVGLATMGCESSDQPKHEVWGKIRYHGQPVRGGVVILAPADGGGGSWGIGVIKPDGDYFVISSQDRIPMTAGRYEVSFRRPPPPGPAAAVDPSTSQIPDKYLDTENPFFSVELRHFPAEVDITLRD